VKSWLWIRVVRRPYADAIHAGTSCTGGRWTIGATGIFTSGRPFLLPFEQGVRDSGTDGPQGSTMVHLLFVCSGNGARSQTAERLFVNHRGIAVKAAPLSGSAHDKVDRSLLGWADAIVVMERHQRRILERRYRWLLCAKRIFCLDIADRYACMEPGLIQLLHDRTLLMMPAVMAHGADSMPPMQHTPPHDARSAHRA
jgi:predicted protein tyrosine phosphatase